MGLCRGRRTKKVGNYRLLFQMFAVSWAPQTNVHWSPLCWCGGRNFGDSEQIKSKIVCIAEVGEKKWCFLLCEHSVGTWSGPPSQPDANCSAVVCFYDQVHSVWRFSFRCQFGHITRNIGIKACAGCATLTSVINTLIHLHIFNSDISKTSFVKRLHGAVKASSTERPMSMYSVYCAMCVAKRKVGRVLFDLQ